MISKENIDLSLTCQCKQLRISRSSICSTPVDVDLATIELMHEIDGIFTKYPFFGNRQIAAYLPRSGCWAGRHRVRRLTGIMGLQAIYKRPNTAKKHRQEAPPAQNLAPLAEKTANHAPQSCLVQRHYLHPRQERLSVACSNPGLGDAQSGVLAALKHAGCQLLR